MEVLEQEEVEEVVEVAELELQELPGVFLGRGPRRVP